MALASLIVKIGADLSDLNKALNKTDRQIQRFGGKMQRAGKNLSAAVTLPLVGIGVAATKMASDAEEAANKFDVVMGPSAARLRDEFTKLHSTIPLASHEMEGLAAGVQDMLVPMGVARQEGAEMSLTMVKLAADIGSFNNANPSQVLEAIQSALAGSSEPMRRFGVDTREAALEAIALSNGLIQAGEKIDMTSRAQAVLLAIQKDSTDAMGDAARTAGSAANTFKFFARDAKELGVTIGEILLPVVTPMVQKMTAGLRLFQNLSPTMQKVVVGVSAFAAALGPLTFALGTILKLLPVLKLGIVALTGPIGLTIAAITTLTTVWLVWGDDIKRIVSETITAVREWLVGKFTAIVDSVKQKVEAVTGFFSNMYEAVVGGSYVPDMIDGIAMQFARLDAVMVQPALDATSKINTAFASVRGPQVSGGDSGGGVVGGIMGALTGGKGAGGILGSIGKTLLGGLGLAGGPAGILGSIGVSLAAPLVNDVMGKITGGIKGAIGSLFGRKKESKPPFEAAGEVMKDLTRSTMKASAALSNVPNVFKVAGARPAPNSGLTPEGTIPPGSRPRHPTNPVVVNFYGGVMDPAAVAEAVGRAVDRASSRGGGSRLSVSFA